MFQVVLTLLALLPKLEAEVTDLPGAEMHPLAAFVVTQSVCEIADLQAADALNPAVPLLASVMLNVAMALTATMAPSAAMLVKAVMAQTGKCEQLVIE